MVRKSEPSDNYSSSGSATTTTTTTMTTTTTTPTTTGITNSSINNYMIMNKMLTTNMTELEWLYNADRCWEQMKKSVAIADYNRVCQQLNFYS